MKLLNQSLLYLTVPIFIVISIWAVVFYFSMFHEVYDSIDNGLDNYKMLIIQKTKKVPELLQKNTFDESNYSIREIPQPLALTVKDVYQDTMMYMMNEEDMEHIRMLTTAFQQDGKYYLLKVISSMVEEDDQISNLLWATFWLYVILIVTIALINNVLLQKLWQPFYRLLEQLKSFRIDKETHLPKMDSQTQEFLELKNAADTLIDRSAEEFDKQKQFIENAAHELQTPLAVIINKLELLLEENTLTNKNAETIAQVMQTANRLIKFNKSLLFLSKIENKQFYDNQSLSLSQVVHQIKMELEDFAHFKSIEISIEETEQVMINMDAHLLNILVMNLVKNAIFHNIIDGRVNIIVNNSSLTVSNTSMNKELDETKIYNRYYKTKNTDKRKSTGLGLPIVKAICNLYKFDISYHYHHDNSEHYFTINFS